MTPQSSQIETGIQLLVEGKDQQNFFEALIRHLGLEGIQVYDFGGINDLKSFLEAFVIRPGFGSVHSVGIIRDAETLNAEASDVKASFKSAFQSVQDSIKNAGLSAPASPGKPSDGNPAVTVLILPDNEHPGMLETLLCKTVTDTGLNRCIDEFLQCAETAEGVPIARPDKARAHAYLATRPHPHVSVGVAAQRGYWDLDHPALALVRQFLKSLGPNPR